MIFSLIVYLTPKATRVANLASVITTVTECASFFVMYLAVSFERTNFSPPPPSSPKEKRVVTKKGLGDAGPKGVQNQEDMSSVFSGGRGKRRQLLVTAPGTTKASLASSPHNVPEL